MARKKKTNIYLGFSLVELAIEPLVEGEAKPNRPFVPKFKLLGGGLGRRVLIFFYFKKTLHSLIPLKSWTPTAVTCLLERTLYSKWRLTFYHLNSFLVARRAVQQPHTLGPFCFFINLKTRELVLTFTQIAMSLLALYTLHI